MESKMAKKARDLLNNNQNKITTHAKDPIVDANRVSIEKGQGGIEFDYKDYHTNLSVSCRGYHTELIKIFMDNLPGKIVGTNTGTSGMFRHGLMLQLNYLYENFGDRLPDEEKQKVKTLLDYANSNS